MSSGDKRTIALNIGFIIAVIIGFILLIIAMFVVVGATLSILGANSVTRGFRPKDPKEYAARNKKQSCFVAPECKTGADQGYVNDKIWDNGKYDVSDKLCCI